MRSSFLLLAAAAVSSLASAISPAEAYGLSEDAILETIDVLGDGKLLRHVLVRGTGETAVRFTHTAPPAWRHPKLASSLSQTMSPHHLLALLASSPLAGEGPHRARALRR